MQCVCIRVQTEAKRARCFQVGWIPSIGTTPERHHWLIEMHKATRNLVGRLLLSGSSGPTERIYFKFQSFSFANYGQKR